MLSLYKYWFRSIKGDKSVLFIWNNVWFWSKYVICLFIAEQWLSKRIFCWTINFNYTKELLNNTCCWIVEKTVPAYYDNKWKNWRQQKHLFSSFKKKSDLLIVIMSFAHDISCLLLVIFITDGSSLGMLRNTFSIVKTILQT